MKKVIFLCCISTLLSIGGVSAESPSFFETNIYRRTPELEQFNDIVIKNYEIANFDNRLRLRDTILHIEAIKTGVLRRYEQGRYDRYAFDTISQHLSATTYHLNQAHWAFSQQAKTGKSFYGVLANNSLVRAKSAYQQLQGQLLIISRDR